MDDLFAALGLLLVIEGILYALFPDSVKRMVAAVFELPPSTRRSFGLVVAVVGVLIIWLVRG